MARIQRITENQVRGGALPSVRIQQPADNGLGALAAGISDVGTAVSQVRQQEQLKADRAAFMEADRTLGERENALLFDPTAGAFSKRGKDALNLTPAVLSEYDKAAGEVEAKLSTDKQKLVFRESAQERRQSIQRQLQQHEFRERENHYAAERESYKETAAQAAVSNYKDPARIEQEIDRTRAVIEQTPGLSADQREAELAARRSGVYAGVIDRYLSNDEVGGAERYYASVKDRVQGEQAANIERSIRVARDRIEAKKESGLALARAELSDQVRDIEAAFKLRLPVSDVPSEARFVALYGERGRKMYAQTRMLADASVDSARLTQLPTDDVVKLAAGYTPTQVAGAAQQAEVASVIQQQARMDLKEREDDPAGYLVRHSPAVQATWVDFSNGGDVQRYLTAVRGEQERLGLPSGDLLPNDYADAVASRISQSGAEGMTNLIQSEAQRWGTSWPQVYGQLAPKLTDIAAVIGSGIPKYAADALASTSGLKTNELQAMIPPGTTLKDVRDKVAGQMEEFNQSFPVDAARTVGAFGDAAVRLTTRYMQQGNSLDGAAKKAFKDLTGAYAFREYKSVPYRVPDAYDADSIEDAATEIVRNYHAPSGSIDSSGSALPSEDLLPQYNEYLRDNAYWMTAPDESGLRLYVDGGPVVTGAGPVQYTWQQLTEHAMKGRQSKQEALRQERAKALERSAQPGLR